MDGEPLLRVATPADEAAILRRAAVLERRALRRAGPGMRHVVVNGAVALRDGALTDARRGEVLRRGAAG
jgi:hypothetical protein